MSAAPSETKKLHVSGAAVVAEGESSPGNATPVGNQGFKESAGRGIWKHCTLSNLFYLYMLYGMLPFGGKDASEKRAVMSAKMPAFKQHFVWEPMGYTNTVAVAPSPAMSRPKPKQNAATGRAYYHGHYSNDKFIMGSALLSIPPRRTSPDSSSSCQAGLGSLSTGALGTEEFDDNPPCDEGKTTKTDTSFGKNSLQSALSSSVIVFDLTLNSNPMKEVSWVRSAVAFLIGIVREKDSSLEVLVTLESNGGSVNSYGLLAEQFRRLREEPNITLTVACDLACLSGGYLAASLASPGRLLASPFAAIGSIGVVSPASALDLREMMESSGIKEVRVKSGERKHAAGVLGGMTDDEVRYAQERSDATHKVFRDHVQRWRSDAITDIDFVSSGDHWLGVDARDHGLVDKLITSDKFIESKIEDGFNVIGMKEFSKQKTGLFGGDAGDKSWFWTIFDWLFPADDAVDDHQTLVSVGRVDPSLARAIVRLLRDCL